MSEPKRLNFIIPEEGYRAVDEMHKSTNQPISEIVKEAIKFYLWAKNEVASGKQILAIDPNCKEVPAKEPVSILGYTYTANRTK